MSFVFRALSKVGATIGKKQKHPLRGISKGFGYASEKVIYSCLASCNLPFPAPSAKWL